MEEQFIVFKKDLLNYYITNNELKIVLHAPSNMVASLPKFSNGRIAYLKLTFKNNQGNVYLNEFYNYTFYLKDNSYYKGIGKFMLCSAIAISLKNNKIDIDDEIYLTTPDYGICSDNYKLLERSIVVEKLQKYKNSENIDGYVNDLDDKDLNDLLCHFENTEKLVKYYESYGFRRIENEEHRNIDMKMKVSDLSRFCTNFG